MKKDFDSLSDKAIKNIEEDRSKTNELLADLINYISGRPDGHAECGMIIAKYLETLQRSNEQLVKISALSKKQDGIGDLSDIERDTIFNELNKNKPKKK